MRISQLAALIAPLVFASSAIAQPALRPEPTVELRVRSLNDLLDKASFVGNLTGQEELLEAIKGLRASIKEKIGLEGIDPTRPFGMIAELNADLFNSSATLMIPIADRDRFLKLLKDRDIASEKAEDGTIRVFVPIVNELYLRFANDYLYVARTVKDLDLKTLVEPRTFFGKDDGAIASLVVRFDRIPDEVKGFFLGQLKLSIEGERLQSRKKGDAIELAIGEWLGDGLLDSLKVLLEDAKELKVRAFANEKSNELSAQISLTAKKDSTLFKTLAALGGRNSLPAAIAGGKGAALRASVNLGLPPELKKQFEVAFDRVSTGLIDKAEPNSKAVVRDALEALAPTFKAAKLDAGVSLIGPDSKGQYALMLAAAVKQGKAIEKLLKELALSAGAVADFDFDVEKIGPFSLHKIVLNEMPPDLEKAFGTKTFWLAIADSHLALSLEPEGTALRAALEAKPVAAPIARIEIAFSKLAPIIGKDLKPDDLKAALADAFGKDGPEGKDRLEVTISGSETFSIEAKIQGNALRLLVALDRLKKK